MKKTNITVLYDETKYKTLLPYLRKKNISLNDELSRTMDNLYAKHVPSQVREFIEMQAEENNDNTSGKPKASGKGSKNE